MTAIAAALVTNRTVRVLDLSQNRVQHGGVRELARALRLNGALHSLKLEEWQDTFDDPQALSALTAAISINKGLRLLSLAGTEIGDRGAIALGPALAANVTLRSLDLSHGDAAGSKAAGRTAGKGVIGDAGLAAIAEALTGNCRLTDLNLQGNTCGPLSALALSDALRLNSTLTSLCLSSCQLDDNMLGTLMSGVRANKTLTTLGLSCVRGVDMHGMRCLADALKHNASLTSLDLSFLQLSEADDPGMRSGMWSVFANGLAANWQLVTLNLAYTGMGEEQLNVLALALTSNQCLRDLDLSGTSVDTAHRVFSDALRAASPRLRSLKATNDRYEVVDVFQVGRGMGAGEGATFDLSKRFSFVFDKCLAGSLWAASF